MRRPGAVGAPPAGRGRRAGWAGWVRWVVGQDGLGLASGRGGGAIVGGPAAVDGDLRAGGQSDRSPEGPTSCPTHGSPPARPSGTGSSGRPRPSYGKVSSRKS